MWPTCHWLLCPELGGGGARAESGQFEDGPRGSDSRFGPRSWSQGCEVQPHVGLYAEHSLFETLPLPLPATTCSRPRSLTLKISKSLKKEEEELRSHKDLYTDIYSSSTHNSSKLETTQTAFNSRMITQVVDRGHRILLIPKRKWNIDTCNDLDGSPENYVEWKKPIPTGDMLYDSIDTTFLKQQNYRNRTVGGCPGG